MSRRSPLIERAGRSLGRAASLLPALLILLGCAAQPAPQADASLQPGAPARAAVTAQAARTEAATPSTAPATAESPASASKRATEAGTTSTSTARDPSPNATATQTAGPAVAGGTALPASQPVEPRFGPGWGDRSIYEQGLIKSERRVLNELAGASEYRIDLRIDDSQTKVTGDQQVRYTNRENVPLNEIYVRLFPNALGGKMRVSEVTVDGTEVTPEYQFEDTAVRVALPQPLPVGDSAVLGLKYAIDVPTTLDQGYGLLSYTNDILALDTPYVPIPVYNEEGWNVETPPANADTSFNDASFYLVRLSAPAALKLVATGVEVARTAEGDRQVVTYEQGPARDFFVTASPDYVVTTTQVGETRVNSYALPGEEAAQANALQTAAAGIPIYNQRFGPYPYTELDVAATPMLALGIEYPGTVGISERVYEADFKSSAGPTSVVLESTVAHELGHQWFYNLVGNDQVDQPWLDEAMAQYSTWLYFLDRYGASAADAWRANWGSRWDRSDRERKPVGLPASAYTEREYGAIVYGRGPLFLTALADRMGQAKFDQFLKDYSARFRWGIATTADFKDMATKACACDLGDLYREWLDP